MSEGRGAAARADHQTPGRTFPTDMLTELFRNPLDPGYADAAERRASGPEVPAWRRQGAFALRMIVLLVTGLLLAVAYRHAIAAEPERARTQSGLVTEAQQARARADDLQRQADELRTQVDGLRAVALGGSSAELQALREREAATGLAPVAGDGAVVQLADAPGVVDQNTGKQQVPDNGLVLDVDLQEVVNGLWNAGAEAISINGERLTATSTIRTAGEAILVDFQPVTGPYVISAIGPDDLTDRFEKSGSAARMRGLANQYGLRFSVRDAEDMQLPAAGTDIPLRYARPESSPSPSGGGG
jgi:uncharacterized protein YlxW (UPF0749 family)